MEPTGPKLAGTSRQSRSATERRQTMRHRTHSPAYARLNAAPADALDLSEILDISEDGMSIQTSSPLEVERTLSLCLDLSETSASIVTTGQVVWSESSGRAGIRFARLSGESLDRLKEWLFANILTAFDHAGAPLADEDRWNSASKVLLPSHTIPKGDFVSGTRVISADDADAMYPGATRDTFARERVTERESELESKQFDREAELQSIAERALTLTRATGAAIALSAENDREMICVASAGDDAPPVRSRLQVGSGFSGECVRTGRSLRCDDAETDDRVDRAGCKSLGIRSLVAVPIRHGSKVVGLLEVFSPQPYAFNADDIGALQQLTGSILSSTGRSEKAPASKIQVSIPTVPTTSLPTTRPVRAEKPIAARPSAVDSERPVTVAKPPRERGLSEPDLSQPGLSQPGLSEPRLTEPISIQPAATQAAAIRPAASQASAVHTSATPARSTQPSVAKALFVAAIGTFIFALLWLIAPWVSSTMRSSGRTSSRAQAAPAAVPKSPAPPASGLPASVTDLASLRKVAEQGDPAAQFSLGARYATGEEVKQDYTEAVRWFTLAADQGHILAQATLGAYYWAGRGVPQDLTKAYYWSVLAQAGGDQASKYRVAVLASRMSRSQVLAAQQEANDWLSNFASHPPAAR
jgi:putative methionine-R-sulfoxide reductase with GAF domain